MRILLLFCALILLWSCRSQTSKSDTIVSMQIIDRNGFTETISNKDRLNSFQTLDFRTSQPYKKVLRVYGRNTLGQSTSKITSYHDNGLLCQYLEVVDGRAHGLYQEWYSNGKMKLEAHLIEGVADIHELAQATWVFEGEAKTWNEQGELIAEFFYVKGLLHTPARYYFPNGKLEKIIPYDQGEVHGSVQVFDENGAVMEEIPYVKGNKQGKALVYWSPGQLLSQEIYENGYLVRASYFDVSHHKVAEIENGKGKLAVFKNEHLESLIEYKSGIPQGEVQVFYPNGSLHITYITQNGKKHGEEWEYYPLQEDQQLQPKLCLHWHEDRIEGQVKTWYPNGQIESQREINGNKKQGLFFAWYKNGDLMLVEEYENDLLLKGSYYKRGDKKAVSKIDSGKGIATLYTNDGIFLRKTSYEKGKPSLNDNTLP